MRAITCVRCGAPLHVESGQRMVRCSFCQVDNDLEPEPEPPAPPLPPMPPPYMAPPHDFPPMMEPDVARRGAGAGLAVAIVAMTLLVLGGAFAFLTLKRSSRAVTMSGPVSVTAVPVPTIPPAPLPPPDAFFVDAHAVPLAFRQKLGATPMGTHVVLYDTYAIASLQDPKRPENVDSYTYRNGKVDDGRPEHFTGTAKELSAKVFSLESADYGLVPKICADAVTRLAVPDGKVSHVYIEKSAGAVVMRVYVSSARSGGFVEYDAKGVMKRVSK